MLKIISLIYRHFVTNVLHIRIKPRVLQMPVTGRCNSRCVTCNIWKEKGGKDIDTLQLRKVLQQSFFNQVKAIGVNGGEPSLIRNIDELLEAFFMLKRLKHLYFISNGLLTERALEMMQNVKQKCSRRGIFVHLCISIDGIESVHNEIRGIPAAFSKTLETVKRLQENRNDYCDVFEAGCTVSLRNVFYLSEIEAFLESYAIPVAYHLAVPNRRLHNFEDADFSVMQEERARLAAAEFFFFRFKYGKGWVKRIRYFLTYYYLQNKGKGRLAGCNYLKSDVTVTENLDLYLCATASRKVGNLTEKTATRLLQEGKLEEVYRETRRYCQNCVHYIVFPTFRGAWYFVGELLRPAVWIKYRWMAWLR